MQNGKRSYFASRFAWWWPIEPPEKGWGRVAFHDPLEFIGQEQACYTALLGLSRRQKFLIEAGDTDELLDVLGEKQAVLDQIGQIEIELGPYKKNWKRFRATLTERDRNVLDSSLQMVEELLAELIAAERESENLLNGPQEKRPDLTPFVSAGPSLEC